MLNEGCLNYTPSREPRKHVCSVDQEKCRQGRAPRKQNSWSELESEHAQEAKVEVQAELVSDGLVPIRQFRQQDSCRPWQWHSPTKGRFAGGMEHVQAAKKEGGEAADARDCVSEQVGK